MQGMSNSPLSWLMPPLRIIVAHAPTENANEEDKDDFYYSLLMIFDDIPRHEVLLLLGDLNVRVGCNNNKNRESWERMEQVTSQTIEKESLTSEKRATSSSAAPSSRIGSSTNSPAHHLMDEPRARLITSSSIANREALFKMCG